MKKKKLSIVTPIYTYVVNVTFDSWTLLNIIAYVAWLS